MSIQRAGNNPGQVADRVQANRAVANRMQDSRPVADRVNVVAASDRVLPNSVAGQRLDIAA